MSKALHHPDTIKVRLRNQNKRRTPNATKVPDRPQLGSTTDQLERNNTKDKIFNELLLSLVASSARTHWHLQAGFGSICESRGLSNLTPSRSRLFKLIGREKVCEVELQQALAYMVANIRKWEREEKAKARSNNYDQEVVLEEPTPSITPTPCSLLGPRREETITVTHAVDVF